MKDEVELDSSVLVGNTEIKPLVFDTVNFFY